MVIKLGAISIVNKLNVIKYRMFNVLKRKKGVASRIRERSVVISLTSYPKRFNTVFLTIESLMNQSVKPDRIVLWLAKEELQGDELPKELVRLQSRGLIIEVVNENLKSYKKLIYALKKYRASNILTCDDDVIYPKKFIERVVNKHKEYPGEIIAYRCSLMEKIGDRCLKPYVEWHSPESGSPSFNLFPTGVGGILYPPDSLNKKVFDKDLLLKLSPLGDDIWFKAMALLNGTKTVMVNDKKVEFPTICGSQEQALWHVNNLEKRNDKQLKNVFDHFNLYKYID